MRYSKIRKGKEKRKGGLKGEVLKTSEEEEEEEDGGGMDLRGVAGYDINLK